MWPKRSVCELVYNFLAAKRDSSDNGALHNGAQHKFKGLGRYTFYGLFLLFNVLASQAELFVSHRARCSVVLQFNGV